MIAFPTAQNNPSSLDQQIDCQAVLEAPGAGSAGVACSAQSIPFLEIMALLLLAMGAFASAQNSPSSGDQQTHLHPADGVGRIAHATPALGVGSPPKP